MVRRVFGALLCAILIFYAALNTAVAAAPCTRLSLSSTAHCPGSSFTVGHVECQVLAGTMRSRAYALAFGVTASSVREELSQNRSQSGGARLNAAPRRYPPRRLLRQLCRPRTQDPSPA